ncbi:sugar phosphate isomerase/epimerase family protein [Olivibacter domesticus]|uniref:Sugar phosphate isomerase/epimerase n=1 Tax=Olivibacter domesticus TaxID=407022 RepID=A0A1H7Q2D6_OLID1|nr:sugar phosphate isomerase/epimerase [Olivibacter domesticus]SEL41854.1 Sugar phosphate isomerase/epimerase [Olivibacter domesticus]
MNYSRRIIGSLLVLLAVMLAPSISKAQDRPEEKLGWKLGTQAYSFNRFTFAEAVAKTDSCKLKFIEAYPGQTIGGGVEGKMDFTMPAEKRAQVLKLLKDKGITLVAFGVVNADSPEGWRQLFEFAKAMGIKNINTEPKQEDLPLIGKLASEFKIKVSIHNHPNPTHYWSPEIVLNAIQLANSEYVGACADIGHWVRSGLDPIACLQKYKGHINHLHFKDLSEKSRDAHDVHWGTGVGNIKGVMQELKNQKFKGMMSAEYEYNWLANSADIAASVENFRTYVKELK